jgi:hypothetical protein
MSSIDPHVVAFAAERIGTSSSHAGPGGVTTLPASVPRRRQKTTPVGRSCEGAPLEPVTSKLVMGAAHARSRHISTRAPVEVAPSCQRNVGRRVVEVDVESGARGRGGRALDASRVVASDPSEGVRASLASLASRLTVASGALLASGGVPPSGDPDTTPLSGVSVLSSHPSGPWHVDGSTTLLRQLPSTHVDSGVQGKPLHDCLSQMGSVSGSWGKYRMTLRDTMHPGPYAGGVHVSASRAEPATMRMATSSSSASLGTTTSEPT